MLITHLSVSQYASKFPLNIQKEWAKVGGRFQDSSFFDRNTNHYKMISMVFEKVLIESDSQLKNEWKKFVTYFLKSFDNGKVGLDKLFISKDKKKIIEKCYPLHTVVMALLPIISQKVAQNERTLYTFLTRDEENSLARFINSTVSNENLSLLGFSHLYKYFSPLVEKDTGPGGKYKIHLMYEVSCNKLNKEDVLGREMVALIALLSIVKDSAFAPITEKFMFACFGYTDSKEKIKEKINLFIDKKILLKSKMTEQFEMIEGSSIDVNEEIQKIKNKELTSKALVNLLKNYVCPSYIIPNKYNFKHHTTRYFRGEIISFEKLLKITPDLKPNYGKEDGILFYVIPFSKDELEQSRNKIKELANECVAFILPETFIECKADLEELNAVNALYTNKDIVNSSPLVKKELDRYKKNLIASIENVVDAILGKTFLKAKCFYPKLRRQSSIKHFSQLNRFLGDVFEEEYKYSIDFNSEYSNKHKITGNIALARKKLINAIIENEKVPLFNLEGNGPEVAMAKALKNLKGLKKNNHGFDVNNPRSSFAACLKQYRDIIAHGGASSENIIQTFISPPFGIRKGILPLIISILDRVLEGPANHYFNGAFITKVDGEHYDMLLKQPKHCHIQFTKISSTRREYISKIGKAFGSEAIGEIQDLLKVIYQWRKAIPESTKKSENLGKYAKKLLVYIDSAQDPNELIFNKFSEVFGVSEINDDTNMRDIDSMVVKLEKTIKQIFNAYHVLLLELRMKMVQALQTLREKCLGERPFTYSKDVNLAKIFQKTLMRLESGVRDYPFSKITSAFLGRVNNFDSSKHQQYFIETVADSLTNSSPRNWDVKGKAMFDFNLGQAIDEIEAVAEYVSSNIGGESAIAFISKNTGDRDFIKLGIITELNDDLNNKADAIEKILGNISERDRQNILANLLRSKKRKVVGERDARI
ncbi:MAG: hypothetical protein OXB84_01105 [Halobacteriovoraceae bacterium]|nr:hypothetical protein [Halobacteriovoraceae bacterium]